MKAPIPWSAVLIAIFGVQPARAQNGEELFQRALVMERASGQLRQAMAIYERIATEYAAERGLAARALIRLGQAHESLGEPGARDAYQRVLRDLADQAEMASYARARLAELNAGAANAPADQAARMLLADRDGCFIWDVRPDPGGTRVAHTNLCWTGALIVRDLATGDTVVLAHDRWYQGAAWSPDGSRIATLRTGYRRDATPGGALEADGGLRILDSRTGADVTPGAVSDILIRPMDWAGSYVAGILNESDGTNTAAVVSIETGRVVRLATRVVQGTDDVSLSPDGNFVSFVDLDDGNQDIYIAAVDGTGRRRITSGPEPDRDPVWAPDGDLLVYQNPAGMWAVPMRDGTATGAAYAVRGEPLSGPIAWTRNGFYHIAENIATEAYQIPVDPATGHRTGPEERLPVAVGDGTWLVWSPDMSRLAFANWDGIMRLYNRARGSVTAFPMGAEFLPTHVWWSSDGRRVLFTTATRGMRDQRETVFALNPDDGTVSELFPRLDSITHLHLSPDGRKMTFVTNLTRPGPKELRVTDLGRSEGLVLARAPGPEGRFATYFGLPVFSPDGSNVLFVRLRPPAAATRPGANPDYRAAVWIAPADGSSAARTVYTTREATINQAFWSPDSRFVACVEVDVRTEVVTLVVVSVETGAREEILSFDFSNGAGPGFLLKYWSPDGRHLGITRSAGKFELWVITDVLGRTARRDGR